MRSSSRTYSEHAKPAHSTYSHYCVSPHCSVCVGLRNVYSDIRGFFKKGSAYLGSVHVCKCVCVHICLCLCAMQKKVVGFGRLPDTIDSDRYMAN